MSGRIRSQVDGVIFVHLHAIMVPLHFGRIKREENGMGYRGKRLLVLFAAALMLLCGTQAIAERMTPVPADRIRGVALPAGG